MGIFLLKRNCGLLMLLFCLSCTQVAFAQIYYHNFGTTTISGHPYNVAPVTFDSHLSNSSWANSTNAWTSTAGATGEAIRLTTATNATITLTFNVAPNYQVEVTSFNLWRQRSPFGPQNWSMTINGINAGNGSIGTTGAALGNTIVANAVSGLTGTITVVISLSGSTGNGTVRLDDFTLNGSVTPNCAAPVITSFVPTTGPQNTLVTINGSGFQLGSGTSSVKFGGINAAAYTVVSDNIIEAYIPAGAISGNVTLITNGCEGTSVGSFTSITTQATVNYSSDIYISEVYDAEAGSGGVIEIYNGTAADVDISNYSIRRYGNINQAAPDYDEPLTPTPPASTILPPGGIFLFGVGNTPVPCNALTFGHFYASGGFNSNDEFKLAKNGVVIDDVQISSAVITGQPGYSITRNPDAIAPKAIFIASDWNLVGTESCTDIGVHAVTSNTLPSVNNQPVSKTTCENGNTSFSFLLSNDAGYIYQWKVHTGAGNWVNVINSAVYSGANSNTLTLTGTPLSFDRNQYYCQVTSAAGTVVSNAAQLEVNAANTIPAFNAVAPICSGDALSPLPTTSTNGIIGSWSPALNNTATTTYTFTPNAGQCASTTTLTITVNNSQTPTFNAVAPICSGDALSPLPTTSTNGIIGSWAPALNNTATTTYTFTPNAGQCASTTTLTITVNNAQTPTFNAVAPICSGDALSPLPTTSTNGIIGSWAPALNNTATTTYTFTPNAGQCASTTTLTITVNNAQTPTFNAVAPICSGDALSPLPTTSTNGIIGSWAPALNNTATTTYTFTPNAGQCASTTTLTITVNNAQTPTFNAVAPICSGDALSPLPTTSANGIIGSWAPALNNTATTTYTFTPNAGQCASTTTLTITVNNAQTPTFNAVAPICSGDALSPLPTTSTNGIIGSWAPALNNTATTTYTFTPNAGQCASTTTLTITVNNAQTPTFNAVAPICSGDALSPLPTTSTNGIIGSWSPALNNTATTTYTFTPNAGQCASTATLTITVNNAQTPTFNAVAPICSGDALSPLPTTSTNGIIGSWAPALNNTATTTYTFTPNAGQCASTTTLTITVNNAQTPTFNAVAPICSGDALSPLPTTSTNGIIGSWSPALNNTATTTYTFTPNAGQCASTATLTITVNNAQTPTFNAVAPICSGDALSPLPTTSTNGIIGSWAPALNNTATTTYTFTPNAGQCASTATLTITVGNAQTPTFNAIAPICSGDALSPLPTTSTNGIIGSWAPALNNTATTIYTFTPNAGQCASTTTLTITVNNAQTPAFNAIAPICSGDALSPLPTTSTNGIIGSWTPALNNTATTTYTFTPNAGQCASTTTLTITVNNAQTPAFNAIAPICSGDALSPLPTTSTNGIIGSWTPALNNTATTTYTFTPNAGQCASTATLTITVNNAQTPTFNAVTPICSGDALSPLPTTSTNGITGNWAPSLDNTATTAYTFTPNAGQCASTATLTITVNNAQTPAFNAVAPICSGDALSLLPTTSTNGIIGSWAPALNNTATTTYTFTPNAGQCASITTLTITVNTGTTVLPINGANAVCAGESIQLSNANDGGNWTSSDYTIAAIDTNGELTGMVPGTVTVTYTLSGSCPSSAYKTITVNALPNPVLNSAYYLCVDNVSGDIISSVDLYCGLQNAEYSFAWTLGGNPIPETSNTLHTDVPGNYTVTAIDRFTGCSMTADTTVGTSSIAIAGATVGDDFEDNQQIVVNVTGGSGQYEYILNDGPTQDSNIFTHIYQGVYDIVVRDKNGCGELQLSVFALNYPHFFTPNGDGYNDYWNISGLYNQPKSQIFIFDRYGKLLTSIRPSSGGWDGRYNGHDLPSSDYWFTLTYKNRQGLDKEFKAHFSLKR